MEQMILKQLRWLKIYALVATVGFASGLFVVFKRASAPPRFEEITVERINVVDQNGALQMVISNQARQHPGIVGGKTMPARARPASFSSIPTATNAAGWASTATGSGPACAYRPISTATTR